MNPPVNAVFLIPNLSTSILEIGDKRNVVPIRRRKKKNTLIHKLATRCHNVLEYFHRDKFFSVFAFSLLLP